MIASAGVCVAAPGTGVATPEGCRALRLHGKNADTTACFEALAGSGDAYRMAEGYWGLEQWEQAKSAFEIALKQQRSPAQWKVRYGMLLHERFNNPDAVDLFNQALAQASNNAQAYL